MSSAYPIYIFFRSQRICVKPWIPSSSPPICPHSLYHKFRVEWQRLIRSYQEIDQQEKLPFHLFYPNPISTTNNSLINTPQHEIPTSSTSPTSLSSASSPASPPSPIIIRPSSCQIRAISFIKVQLPYRLSARGKPQTKLSLNTKDWCECKSQNIQFCSIRTLAFTIISVLSSLLFIFVSAAKTLSNYIPSTLSGPGQALQCI